MRALPRPRPRKPSGAPRPRPPSKAPRPSGAPRPKPPRPPRSKPPRKPRPPLPRSLPPRPPLPLKPLIGSGLCIVSRRRASTSQIATCENLASPHQHHPTATAYYNTREQDLEHGLRASRLFAHNSGAAFGEELVYKMQSSPVVLSVRRIKIGSPFVRSPVVLSASWPSWGCSSYQRAYARGLSGRASMGSSLR